MENVVIIDSGIGGLTVYNHLLELSCNTNVTYLADNRFFPYGTKDDTELKNIIDRILTYFVNHHYQHIFLACNTASVIYNKYFTNRYPVHIYPIIENTVDELLKLPNCKNVGVIGTNKTITDGAYQDRIKQIIDVDIVSLPCSDLVLLCEKYDVENIRDYIKSHFAIFKESNIDTLILGCTHFNVIKTILDEFFNHQVRIICSGYAMIEALNKQFESDSEKYTDTIYVTSKDHQYESIMDHLFPKLKAKKIEILDI